MYTIITGTRASISAIENNLKLFQAFPALHSRFIPAEGALSIPVQSDLSENALQLMAASGMDVTLSGYRVASKLVSSGSQRRQYSVLVSQYRALFDPSLCFGLARDVVRRAAEQKVKVAKRICTEEEDIAELLRLSDALVEKFNSVTDVSDNPNWRELVFNPEALVTQAYFQVFGEHCRSLGWKFGGRTRRPAKDAVNAMLNYGYAILKSVVDLVTVTSGLDPYVGFLHTLRPGRESLSLDLIEPLRQPVVDHAVLEIIGDLDEEKHFEYRTDEVRIGDTVKEALQAHIHRKLYFHGEEKPAITTLTDSVTDLIETFSRYVQAVA